jgi:hypothetical protein
MTTNIINTEFLITQSVIAIIIIQMVYIFLKADILFIIIDNSFYFGNV